MQEIIRENQDLEKKLKELQQQQKTLQQQKKKQKHTAPMSKIKFIPENKDFKQVSSQIDYETNKIKVKEKEELNKIHKELEELKNCSFQPKLNQNSTRMITNHVSIFERELPKRKQTPPPKEEEGLEEVYDPHPKRKHNEKFYEEQLLWD